MNKVEKVYLTKEDLESIFSIKKSLQAKLRMEKKIPYTRPAGSKVILYNRIEIEEWLDAWKIPFFNSFK